MAGIVSEEFLVKDIEDRIKDNLRSRDYIEGFTFACYLLHGITSQAFDELKVYLNEKYTKEEK